MEKRRFMVVLVVVATILGGIAVASADAPADAAAPGAATHARKKKKPRRPAPPKASDSCTTDDDCVFTAYEDGACCPTLCQQRAVAKSSAEAIEKYAAVCQKPAGGCPHRECAPPLRGREPACVSGKCVARAAPSPERD